MTYYKNQPNVTNDINNLEFLEEKNTPDVTMNTIVTNVFAKIHGFLIITNVTGKKTNQFYCLKIDKKEINLVEKNPTIVNKFSYDIPTHDIFLNDKQMNDTTTNELCHKIIKIFKDLKQKKAYAFEHY